MKPDIELMRMNLSLDLTALLQAHLSWQQQPIKIFGRVVPQPRLYAWEGDTGISYTYSHLQLVAQGWSPLVLDLKNKVENLVSATFNSVLINYYRHGLDYMGWHSDDEKELGPNPFIASLSLGASRDFDFRYKNDHSLKHRLTLHHGDLLIMKGSTQNSWQHALPKRTRIHEPRINLTFRKILF